MKTLINILIAIATFVASSTFVAAQQLDLSRTKGNLPVSRVVPGVAGQCLTTDVSGHTSWATCAAGGSGSGTVTSFSAGTLSPLFSTSVATATSTPALSFTLSNAAAHKFFGNNTGTSGAPGFVSITTADLPGVFAQTIANVAHQWLNSYDATTGLFTQSQPAYTDLSGLPTLAVTKSSAAHQFLNSYTSSSGLFTSAQPDYSDLTGTPTLPATLANVSHKWLNSYSSVTGLFTQTQPDYSDLTGTPALPSNTTSTAHNFFTAYNSGTGAFTKAQPATADLSDFPSQTGNSGLFLTTNGTTLSWGTAAGGGGGTVSSFSAGALSPLFTTSVATATTTPTLSFTLSTAAAHTFFGNNTASTAAPAFAAIGNGDLPGSGAVTVNTTSPLGGGGSLSLGNSLTLTCGTCLTSVTSHNLLSATHGDTTPASAVRGDGIFAIGATPTWQRLAHPTATGGYFKWNGTDMVASTGAASGTGSPTGCTNQFVTAFTLNADGAPTSTCSTVAYGQVSGTPTLPANTTATTHQFFTAYNSATGAFTKAQPDYSDLTGTPQLAISKTCTGTDKVSAYDSTTGLFTCSADQTGAGGGASTEVQVDGVDTTSQTPINFQDSSSVTFSNPSAGNVQASVVTPVATASALAANPSDCSAGQFATGVDATGAAQGCAPASDGWVYLGSTVLASNASTTSTVTLSSTMDVLFIIVRVTGYTGTDIASMRFNGDTGQNYWDRHLQVAAGGTTLSDVECGSSTTGCGTATNRVRMRLGPNAVTTARTVFITCGNRAATSKVCDIRSQVGTGTAATAGAMTWGGGEWVNTSAAISSVVIVTNGGNSMLTGTGFVVFGRNF
jgi:hypothetical protein